MSVRVPLQAEGPLSLDIHGGEGHGHIVIGGKQHPTGTVAAANCANPGCEAHSGLYRIDGKHVTAARAAECAVLAGWVRLAKYQWVCPPCFANPARDKRGSQP